MADARIFKDLEADHARHRKMLADLGETVGDSPERREMFEALGRSIVLDERYQDAATAISGSGPAYVALFVDALARAGVRQGLSRDVSQALALQTLRGTVELIERTGAHPEAVIDAVSSPGGATIAAIEAFEASGLRSGVFDAVAAAVRRSKELGS